MRNEGEEGGGIKGGDVNHKHTRLRVKRREE